MSSIKKQVLVNGQAHFIEVNSSLELEEVEITGMDPASGKVVQVALSPLLKPSPKPFDANPFSAGSPQQPSPYSSPSPAYTAPFSSPPPSWPSFGESSPPSNSPPPSWQDVPAPSALRLFDSPPQMDMFSEMPNPTLTPPLSITPPLSQGAPAASDSPPPFGTPAGESAPLSPPPFSEQQGLAGVRQKTEKEEVDDTLNGMYRY